jgi:hypothetical protein
MLGSVDQHFKVKDPEVVLCVLSYITCANIEIRKHLQGHLKRALNLQNVEQKVRSLFAVLKQQKKTAIQLKLRATLRSRTDLRWQPHRTSDISTVYGYVYEWLMEDV